MESERETSEGKARSDKDRVIIFDTTLRDGEQCPGATMTFDEKLEVAELLDEMGVDVIEAGFPIASQGDFESVQEIARRAEKSVICGLARAQMKDIDVCADAIKPAKRGRIHTFIGTSPLHRKYQMGIEEAEVLERIAASVTRARTYTDDVEWSAMDATRTEHDFLCRCVEAAIKAGATTVNIPDTVGYATPDEFAGLIRMLLERVPGADGIAGSGGVDVGKQTLDWDFLIANPVAPLSASQLVMETPPQVIVRGPLTQPLIQRANRPTLGVGSTQANPGTSSASPR